MTQRRGRVRPAWLISVVVVVIGAALFTSAMGDVWARNSSRDAVADLGTAGRVTVRFSTDPNPPVPGETVRLNFVPLDAGRRPLAVDGLSYEYGRAGSDQPEGGDPAEPMDNDSGMWMGMGHFTAGDWWVQATLSLDGRAATVEYTLRVEAAK